MTTAFQEIFNRAESISINRRATVSQTITRSNVVRSVKRGEPVWRFEVRLPDGIPWTELRPYIEAIDYADRYTTGTVQINNSGYNSWLTNYQGAASTTSGWSGSWTQGATSISVTPAGYSSGLVFKAGDIIQLGNGRCYSVAADTSSTSVTLNRPVLDSSGSGAIKIGPACTWTVVCTDMPQWSIFARNQVSWSGAFTFYEYML